jgi:hypothetical protein
VYRSIAATDALFCELRRDAANTTADAAAVPLKSWEGRDVWRWTFADGRSHLYVVGDRWFVFPTTTTAEPFLLDHIPVDFMDAVVTILSHAVDGELPVCVLCQETMADCVLPCVDARTGECVGKHRLCEECAAQWVRSHLRSLDAWYADTVHTEAEALARTPRPPVLTCPLCRCPFDVGEVLPLSRLAVDRRRRRPPPAVDLAAALRGAQIRRRNERPDAPLRGIRIGGDATATARSSSYHRSALTTQSLPPEYDTGIRYDGGYAFVGGTERCAAAARCHRTAFVRFNCGHKVWCLRCYNGYVRRRGGRMGRVPCPRPVCRARIATAAYSDTDTLDFRAH